MLEADAVQRSEKAVGVARWLLALHDATGAIAGRRRDDLLWRAVAGAPPGFCHIRSSMIGTLLEDLAGGLSFAAVKARWDQKMHPLQYQRPTVVKQGTIERAEKVVAELRSAGALERRYARLADVTPLWVPASGGGDGNGGTEPSASGVFGHLRADASTARGVDLPAVRTTWEKFARTALDGATGIDVLVPQGPAAFFGLVTATDPQAPPILQWDGEPRNAVSWYFYVNGSQAPRWGLTAGTWCPVTAIFARPPHWHDPDRFRHHARGVFFALRGCRDLEAKGGAGFFPEQLRSEYHEIRSVMEAYARTAEVGGRDEGDANGLALEGAQTVTARTTGPLGSAVYEIDRID